MSMTDPIADMLTRIRNANKERHDVVRMPASNKKVKILEILVSEGYINGFDVVELENNKKEIWLNTELQGIPEALVLFIR